MRTIVCATLISAGLGLVCISGSWAMPVNPEPLPGAAGRGPVTEQVHCRRYPHRHSGANPHGFGFGCPKKAARFQDEKLLAKITPVTRPAAVQSGGGFSHGSENHSPN